MCLLDLSELCPKWFDDVQTQMIQQSIRVSGFLQVVCQDQ